MTRTTRLYSRNADFQRFQVLLTNRPKRTHYGLFLCEGVRNLNEAVRRNWEIVSFLYAVDRELSSWASGMLRNVPAGENFAMPLSMLRELSGKEDTSELMAVIRMREDKPAEILAGLPENPLIALFDRPSNHGNLGTIIRSADALAVDALILTGHGVDLYAPEVVTSTMGSFFKVPVLRLGSNAEIEGFLDRTRARYPDLLVLGTTAHATEMIYDVDLRGPVLFLIGNETEGLTQHYREICDLGVKIPMAPDSYASSFNVGCAATVMFYEAARQRGMRS